MKKFLLFSWFFLWIFVLVGCSEYIVYPENSNNDEDNVSIKTGDNIVKKDYFNKDAILWTSNNKRRNINRQSKGGIFSSSKKMLNSNISDRSFSMNESLDMAISPQADFEAEKIWFKIWLDQDINLFRENILNWYIPNTDILTYNGVFSDYHFDLPDWNCETMFCPLMSYNEFEQNWKTENRLQIGLWSNIKENDFKRLPTNFVFVVDRSGSMGWNLDSYYYDNVFDDDRSYCAEEEVLFRPNNQCIPSIERDIYKKSYDDNIQKNKMTLAMESLTKMINKLNPDDKFWLVLFNDWSVVAHPLVEVRKIDIEALKKHILDVRETGWTNMAAWMREWLNLFDDDISQDSSYQNRLVFITDAMPNIWVSSPDWLGAIAKKWIDKWIYMSFMWVWIDFQQQFVQNLSKEKGTNYFYISDSRDFQRRLVDEFDYNFFPMLFDLEFKINDMENIEKIYWIDVDNQEKNLFTINTMFPTPTTSEWHRWSIILMKLKEKPSKSISLSVNYTKYDWSKENSETYLDKDSSKSESILKWVVLIKYLDALKNSINDGDYNILSDVKILMEENKYLFEWDDKWIFQKEFEVLDKLVNLLENKVNPKNDYWQAN